MKIVCFLPLLAGATGFLLDTRSRVGARNRSTAQHAISQVASQESKNDNETKSTGFFGGKLAGPADAASEPVENRDSSGVDLHRRETLAGTAAFASLPLLMKEMEHSGLPGFIRSSDAPAGLSAKRPSSLQAVPDVLLEGDTIVRNLWLNRLAYPVLVVALEIGLFEALKGKRDRLTRAELGSRTSPQLSASGRVLEAIIAVLSSLKLLQVVDNGNRVSLTPEARQVLVRDSPYYWGHQLLAADGLTSSFRRAVHRDDRTPAKGYAADHSLDQVNSFIDSMQAHGSVTALATATALRGVVGPSAPQPCSHILDMAGGSGCFSKALADAYGVQVTLADIPSVVARYRNKHPFMQRIRAVPADLFEPNTWPVGPDTHLLANVLHDWGKRQSQAILNASYMTLSKASTSETKGRVLVIEQLLDDSKAGPLPAALASVSMLLGDWRTGKQYSFVELKDMMLRAGFSQVDLGPKCGNFHTAVIASV